MATQGVVLIYYEQLVKTVVGSLMIPLMLWNYLMRLNLQFLPQILGGLRENAYLCNRDLLT